MYEMRCFLLSFMNVLQKMAESAFVYTDKVK